jgi:hypothetical protein
MNIAQAKGIQIDIDKDFDVQIVMPQVCGCCATFGFVSAERAIALGELLVRLGNEAKQHLAIGPVVGSA